MNDSSRTQGGLICIGVVIVGAWFLLGLLQQSYWALAIPGGDPGLLRARADASGSATRSRRSRSSPTEDGEPEPAEADDRSPAPRTGAHLSVRAVRIALLTYRGNMYCGGQGIYAAYLAREWQRAGHDVHVFAGPPLPELEPGHPAARDPERQRLRPGAPATSSIREHPFSLLKPLSLWELGVSRFGVFPEMQTFGLRLLRRWRRSSNAAPLRHRLRQPVPLAGGCWASRPPGPRWSR